MNDASSSVPLSPELLKALLVGLPQQPNVARHQLRVTPWAPADGMAYRMPMNHYLDRLVAEIEEDGIDAGLAATRAAVEEARRRLPLVVVMVHPSTLARLRQVGLTDTDILVAVEALHLRDEAAKQASNN
jgi:hypothetical protein